MPLIARTVASTPTVTIDILMTLMTAFSDEPGLIDSLLGEELFLSDKQI